MTDNTNANVSGNTSTNAPAHGNESVDNKTQINLDLNNQPENKNVQKPETNVQVADDKDKPKDTPNENATFEKVGYVGIDFAFDFIGKLGYTPDSEAVKQAYQGNFELIEAELAINPKAQGYDKVLELAKRDFNTIVQEQKKAMEENEKSALKVFGGDEAKLQEVLEFARNNSEPHEKEIFNRMFSSSPLEAEMAMHFLRYAYEKASGTTVTPKEATVTNIQQSPSSYALSPQDYIKEVQNLYAKYGYVDGHPEYAKLQARRKAYRG